MKVVLYLVFSWLYMIGEAIQFLHFGPAWLTGHLSDFGFVFAFGLFLNIFLPLKISLISAWIFAMTFECLQFTAHQGDVYDVFLFTVALIAALYLTKGKKKLIE